jgi:SAM-dependent methyltransferase
MHAHRQHHQHDHDDLAELLDLDGEVLHEFHAGIVAWVREQAAGRERRVVVDLGAGTGTGTFELLAQLPGAAVVAVDSSAEMLHRLAAHAARRGLDGRLRTVVADLDDGWPAGVGPADLVWAANSMHHMADPARVLGEIRAALAPGGLFAVVELESFPAFLPEGDGLEQRVQEAISRRRAEDMPHLGADWGAALASAGFEVRARRHFAARLSGPLPPAAARYAQASLRRARESFADDLGADDRARLDALLEADGPGSITRRTDLTVRTARTAWIAAGPA